MNAYYLGLAGNALTALTAQSQLNLNYQQLTLQRSSSLASAPIACPILVFCSGGLQEMPLTIHWVTATSKEWDADFRSASKKDYDDDRSKCFKSFFELLLVLLFFNFILVSKSRVFLDTNNGKKHDNVYSNSSLSALTKSQLATFKGQQTKSFVYKIV